MTSIVAILRLLFDDSPPFATERVSNLLGIASAVPTYSPSARSLPAPFGRELVAPFGREDPAPSGREGYEHYGA